MVISALKEKLKGKPKAPEDAPQEAPVSEEDIPDELPPLMEDDEEPEAPKEEPKEEAPAEPAAKEEPQTPKEEAKEAPQEKPKEAPKQEARPQLAQPKPAPDLKRIEAEVAAEEAKLTATLPPLDKPAPTSEFYPQNAQHGFFGTLNNVVKATPQLQDELLNQDLVLRMKSYWTAKQSLPSGAWDSEHRLQEELEHTMRELQNMESKWHLQALALENERKQLHVREQEIKEKSKSLQKLLRAARFFRKVEDQRAFTLCNGMRVHSLKELFDAVSVLDDTTFGFHVRGKKNDFASWVNSVFEDAEVSQALRAVTTRSAMLKVLEGMTAAGPQSKEPSAFHRKKKRPVHPRHHFKTCTGRLIRTLDELPDAIRAMEDDEFHHHVTPYKNDFAKWVLEVFKKKDLAKRMNLVTGQEEMINILDVYL